MSLLCSNVVWCLTHFKTVIQLYQGGQCTYPCFLGIPFTGVPHIFPMPLANSHITIVERMYSGERGMNPVAMNIMNPRKEY